MLAPKKVPTPTQISEHLLRMLDEKGNENDSHYGVLPGSKAWRTRVKINRERFKITLTIAYSTPTLSTSQHDASQKQEGIEIMDIYHVYDSHYGWDHAYPIEANSRDEAQETYIEIMESCGMRTGTLQVSLFQKGEQE